MVKVGIVLAVLAISFFSISSAQLQNLLESAQKNFNSSSAVGDASDSHTEARKLCPAACLLNKKDGRGFAKLSRWYFNRMHKKCESFTYGGIRGNANRFKTRKNCMEKCGLCREHDVQALAASEHPNCDCDYRRTRGLTGGCKITVAPPQGYKCQCHYKPILWRCSGTAIKCVAPSTCPANCFSKPCCLRGAGRNGNCNGYTSYMKGLPTNSAVANGLSKLLVKPFEMYDGEQ